MKNTFQKIALIAHACISFIFVLLTMLILFDVLPLTYQDNQIVVDSIVLVLMVVLAVCYAGLTAYLLYCAFNQTQLLKYVELYRDSTATVMATSKTIKNMVNENAKLVGNVKVDKVKVASDGKYGLILRVWVQVSGDQVSYTLDTLRCACEDSFYKVLGLRFTGIDFKIKKIDAHYQPDVQQAQKQAQILQAERTYARDCYQDPLCDKCDEETLPQGNKSQPTEQTNSTAEEVTPTETAVEEKQAGQGETDQDNSNPT